VGVPVIMGVGGPLGARLLHAWSVLPVVSTSDRETAPGSNDEAMASRFPEIVRGGAPTAAQAIHLRGRRRVGWTGPPNGAPGGGMGQGRDVELGGP
jgi:hypothetical protein